jgi:MFS family permease
MASAITNPRMIIRESSMKAFQWVAIGLCVAMTALDGFDVLSVSFVGPELAREWGVTATQQANMGNAGLFGMIVGSLIFSPVADVIGRRNVLLVSLSIVTVGMFASALVTNVEQMLALRFVTGFGIGTMFAPVNSMAAEYANNKRRGVAIGLNVLGYPLGTTVGGLIASWMLDKTGTDLVSLIANSVTGSSATGLGLSWQWVFILGGVLTAVLIPLVLIFMPESMEFLLSKRPKNALKQVNVLMKKLGHEPLTQLPPPDAEAARSGGIAQVFEILKQPYLARVIIIVVAYFMTISVFYFGNFLAPRVLSQIGFDASTSRLATISITVGGMIGSLAFGILAARFKFQHLTTLVCVLGTVMTSVIGLLLGNVYTLIPGLILIGFFINAGIAGFYTGMAAAFPAHLRATGSGFTLGVGRFGAMVGPFVGGVLLDANFEFGRVYLIVGLTMLISAVFMQFLRVDDPRMAKGAALAH